MIGEGGSYDEGRMERGGGVGVRGNPVGGSPGTEWTRWAGALGPSGERQQGRKEMKGLGGEFGSQLEAP